MVLLDLVVSIFKSVDRFNSCAVNSQKCVPYCVFPSVYLFFHYALNSDNHIICLLF